MAYQNNNGYNNRGGYNNNRNGYNNSGYNGNNNGYNNQPKKKKSGCKRYSWVPNEGPNKGHKMMGVLGWTKTGREPYTTYRANMTSKSKEGKNGWVGSVIVEIIANKQKSIYWGMMNVNTGMVIVQELNLCMSPNGGKGGYVGKLSKN